MIDYAILSRLEFVLWSYRTRVRTREDAGAQKSAAKSSFAIKKNAIDLRHWQFFFFRDTNSVCETAASSHQSRSNGCCGTISVNFDSYNLAGLFRMKRNNHINYAKVSTWKVSTCTLRIRFGPDLFGRRVRVTPFYNSNLCVKNILKPNEGIQNYFFRIFESPDNGHFEFFCDIKLLSPHLLIHFFAASLSWWSETPTSCLKIRHQELTNPNHCNTGRDCTFF